MKTLHVAVLAAAAFALGACSKAPEATAQNAGPDNTMTRYAENLVQSEKRAQATADKANAVIAGQQRQMDQTADESK